MTRLFCKACSSPAQELMEFIRLLPWWKPTLLRRTVPQGEKAAPYCSGPAQAQANGRQGVKVALVDLQVDRCAEECLHTPPIPWKQNQEVYQLRYVFGCAMEGSDLPCYILWPERTAEQSFWCIDAWKGDWVRLDTCACMAPLGIEHFLMLFASTHKGSGGQLQSKLWASLPAVYQRMPIWKICTGAPSRLRLGVFRRKGKHLRRGVKLIRTWLQRRRGYLRLALMLTVDGLECQTTPPRTRNVRIWRPHQLPLTRIGSTLAMRRCRTWQMTSTTLTSHGTPEVAPVRMRQEFS